MDLKDIRRENLLLIIRDVFNGRQVELARRMGRKEAQITQWKSEFRGLHESSCRLIERAAGKPVGWMDQPHASGTDPLSVQEPTAVRPYQLPRPSLRVSLEVLCTGLSVLQEPERRESVGTLLKACAVAGGDTSYIEAFLATMRKHQPPQTLANGTK